MCYNSDFGRSEDESSCAEGENVQAYRGPRVIAPEEVAALSRAVSLEPIASCNSNASIDRLFVSTDIFTGVSTDDEEDKGQFQGE